MILKYDGINVLIASCVPQCVVPNAVYVALYVAVISLSDADGMCLRCATFLDGDQGGVGESCVRHVSLQIEIYIFANSNTLIYVDKGRVRISSNSSTAFLVGLIVCTVACRLGQLYNACC
jgi:hypothetical protein